MSVLSTKVGVAAFSICSLPHRARPIRLATPLLCGSFFLASVAHPNPYRPLAIDDDGISTSAGASDRRHLARTGTRAQARSSSGLRFQS